MKTKLSPMEKVKIADRIPASVSTVDRVYAGKGSAYSRARVAAAAAELGLPQPGELTQAQTAQQR